MQIIRNDDDVRAGLEALLRLDPRLRPLAEAAGPLPLRLVEPGFAGLAHVVVSQMVSRASAQAIWGRICADGAESAERYAALAPDMWRSFGLSRGKAETLQRVAALIVGGRLDLAALALDPPQTALAKLVALKGIGPWTAEVYLMFSSGHADVFPAGDVALQAGFAMAFDCPERPTAKELAAAAAAWTPWRSVAARLLWAYYAARLKREAVPVG